MKIEQTLTKLTARQDLRSEDAESLMDEIMEGKVSTVKMGALLIGLRVKRETPEEILGFIRSMRKHMRKVKTEEGVIDTCGTGGDGKGTFNISTAVALTVAGAGVKVAKHGNRAASSQCGSADVLENLGVNITIEPAQAAELLDNVGMTFLFAPFYHLSMKHVLPIRRELKIRTVFNFLGPFVNPAAVKRQLIGISDVEMAKKIANIAPDLGYEHLLIVCARDGMDEISLSSPTEVFEVKSEAVTRGAIYPEDYGIPLAPLEALAGGDAEDNAKIIQQILAGKEGPQKDIVVLNTAAALYVAGRVGTIAEGLEIAQESIRSGSARRVLDKLIKESKKYLSA